MKTGNENDSARPNVATCPSLDALVEAVCAEIRSKCRRSRPLPIKPVTGPGPRLLAERFPIHAGGKR